MKRNFNLQAAVGTPERLKGTERLGIERWSRYALRGPLAASRLSLGPNDMVVYQLAKSKPDGTTQVVFPVVSFLRRLTAVMPPPRRHTIVYHGVFAAAHRWRAEVVESTPRPTEPMCRRKARRLAWAELLRRVFLWDVLACACGGTRRVLATIATGPVADKILKHLGLPTTLPVAEPARLGMQTELWDTGPPVDQYSQAQAQDDFDQRLAESELPD